jgi:hypothetical protein
MRNRLWTVVALLAAVAASGCNGPSKRTLAATEPGLTTEPGDPQTSVLGRSRPKADSPTFASRHPLLPKPRR